MSEELEQAVALIQEAKGLADGPNGGNVTDHLDFAESWIDKAADRIEALTAENERLREGLTAYTEYWHICHGRGSFLEEDAVTGAVLWRNCPGCTPARAALGDTQ